MRLVTGRSGRAAGKGSPIFTWADSVCADFRAGTLASAQRQS